MNKILKYFSSSFVFTIIALVIAFFVGFSFGGNLISAGISALFTTLMLGILETSLSFDNAVVNAKVLDSMSLFWRKMFLTIGMIIAVFGMRVFFPLIIVWLVSGKEFLQVVFMTWQNPQEFQNILINQHIVIAGFGGSFLWMVFTKFFIDEKKEIHWLSHLEKILSKVGKVEAAWVGITMIISFVFYNFIDEKHRSDFLLSTVLGIITFLLVEGLSSFLGNNKTDLQVEKKKKRVTKIISTGFASFIYLEVLDSSFSFDGVIGAFAITNNIFIIALGLGIGAFFVRSLTIKLVEDKTLSSFRYLEHGAFWAIGALSLIMYISAAGIKIPEVVSGFVGIFFIGLSVISSILYNKKNSFLNVNK